MEDDIKLFLIRGAPGSGKSTLAKKILEQGHADVHYEADMYFMEDGEYKYDHTKISQAHDWCRDIVLKALLDGKRVVVSNTFTKLWELESYIKLAYISTPPEEGGARIFSFSVGVCEHKGESTHGVPEEIVQRMRDNFEPFEKSDYDVMRDRFEKELSNVH